MKSSKFKITMKGEEAGDSLRLSDLIDQLNALKQTLNQIDMSVSGSRAPSLYYRVTKITMNSPATFELEAVSKTSGPSYARRVVSRLDRDIRKVISGKRPTGASLDLMESYGSLSGPLRKHVAEVILQFDSGQPIDLPRNLNVRVDEILGPDQVEEGSVVGSLDVIDVHNQRNYFKVYPIVGPRSVKCFFPSGMLAEALAGINRSVRISGQLHFKKAEKHPHLIKVRSIEVLPERSEVPSLSSLRGLAPGACEGMKSEDYVNKVRNGDW
ncbi:Uncharacterised protein [Achromobacter sp. 2789STDY5608633]|jgi:hypothetical protein|uniref:Uncharacterized protein n=1 Tax=Achromobacter insuavis TaxID=1287735 RepID=A0A6J4ZNG6_9BURK|nr:MULTISPECIES: hypothetical protein [Achromobacter]QQE59144.1 hypothetical protein I6H41_09160 [Achromobacter xylosoxidans]QQV12888.1 hypothetical protein I6I48_24280 [Achromobacter xylosoxidans]CAB3627291.1 hypothetical protein LMG26845_00397 [Achromobacter insuavis]CUJ47773.1 Uncharacterised protein [Achromobacter sp. 2789STDY5608633]